MTIYINFVLIDYNNKNNWIVFGQYVKRTSRLVYVYAVLTNHILSEKSIFKNIDQSTLNSLWKHIDLNNQRPVIMTSRAHVSI